MHTLMVLLIFACVIALLIAYFWCRDTHRPSDLVADKIWNHVRFGPVKPHGISVRFRLSTGDDICIELWHRYIMVDGRDISETFSRWDRAAIFYRASERLQKCREQARVEAAAEARRLKEALRCSLIKKLEGDRHEKAD